MMFSMKYNVQGHYVFLTTFITKFILEIRN